jgi:hypothetical protein
MGNLADYTIDQMAGALALTLGSVGGLCLILFKSRCERISVCWGLWSCNRKVSDDVIDSEKNIGQDQKDEQQPGEQRGGPNSGSTGITTASTEPTSAALDI